jgi:G3E family GTPase
MLKAIPTHLVAGPLGAGKTSLIGQLLAQRPPAEHWAILINEFGQIGVDAALLDAQAPGVSIREIAGGCLCCVNGVPFQVGLSRLLRQARPDRLFIEPSGLGHPGALLQQLGQAPWSGVLALQPLLLVLDAAALARAQDLPEAQREMLGLAGLLLLNKSETLDDAARDRLQALLGRPLIWTSQGQVAFDRLPVSVPGPRQAPAGLPHGRATPPLLWRNAEEPFCLIRHEGHWSIGWRWHPSQRFDRQRLHACLQGLPWLRAKLVLHCAAGWFSANLLKPSGAASAMPAWQSSEWRKDSRLELIFTGPQDGAALQAAIGACRL